MSNSNSNSNSNSIRINKWASGSCLFRVGDTGEGENQIVGWERLSDGHLAIETNGDPVFEGDPGFNAAWARITGEPATYPGSEVKP